MNDKLLNAARMVLVAYEAWDKRKDGGEDDLHHAVKELRKVCPNEELNEDKD